MTEIELNELTRGIIGIAIEIHRELGPGLLSRIYQRCLQIALREADYEVLSDIPVPVIFRGKVIDDEGYRINLLVNETVVLEIRSVSTITPLLEKQLGTYLKLSGKPCGLLINFNSAYLKEGIKRIRNGFLPL